MSKKAGLAARDTFAPSVDLVEVADDLSQCPAHALVEEREAAIPNMRILPNDRTTSEEGLPL
jgi:hypothetical protein